MLSHAAIWLAGLADADWRIARYVRTACTYVLRRNGLPLFPLSSYHACASTVTVIEAVPFERYAYTHICDSTTIARAKLSY